MKTEDLKNYIFEQYLTEAKTHPLVKAGAQWVVDNVGGDPKKIAGKMTRGISRTTNEPTAEHVYNAAQFHFGEILRKNSPGMDRPEVYADMRKRLRAHLGLDGEVNETSDALKRKLEDGRVKQAMRAYDTSHDIAQENFKIKKQTGSFDPSLLAVRDIISNRANKAHNSYTKANNRRNGLKGDGSPRTSTQESAFNFINGLKQLQETKKFPPITIEELQSPDATKHHARRGVKHSDPKVAIEALNLAFRLKDAKTAWMGKDHPDQEVQDTAQMSLNMHED